MKKRAKTTKKTQKGFKPLQLEVAAKHEDKTLCLDTPSGVAVLTPPIDENYWLARVRVTARQAVVCFHKFGVIGIGFQHEQDWNTNLPYSCSTEKIYDHIEHNKGNGPSKEDCLKAIKMLQEFAAPLMEAAQRVREAFKASTNQSATKDN